MFEIGLTHYLVVATLLFVMGIFVMITKRNAIGILIGVEMVLNGASVNLVAFNRYGSAGLKSGAIDGQVMSLFVIVLAAAEAALAVAICMNFYRSMATVDVDRGDALAG